MLPWVLGVLADSPPGAKMIKILWQDWAHNWIFGIIRPTFGSNASPWSWSLIKVHQPLLEASLPFPGPHDYTCLCHDSLYQNTFSKAHLCKWISFWFQCIFGTHSCYRHPHLSYLQKMDCYHQEGGTQKHWLTLREKLFCTAGRASCVGAKRQFWPQLYEPAAQKLNKYTTSTPNSSGLKTIVFELRNYKLTTHKTRIWSKLNVWTQHSQTHQTNNA